MLETFRAAAWQPPAHWSRITTIDMHTGGEPLRVIAAGLPLIEGHTVLEKRRFFREHCDHLRTGLMWEPRGHVDMYGAVVTPAEDDADWDVFFLHNEGYSTMCGHAIIALATLAGEIALAGGQAPARQLAINVPAGRVTARVNVDGGVVRGASFQNVPPYVLLREQGVDGPEIG